MIANFEKIGTRELFTGNLPNSVTLPVFINKNGVVVCNQVTTSMGEEGWEEALFRFMFLNGYCLPEDNNREMKV